MSRYLFVVPPFVGHVMPLLSVARELTHRGNTVGWVVHPEVRWLLPPDDACFRLPDGISPQELEAVREKTAGRWLPGLKAFWEDFVLPLARRMLPGTLEAVDRFQPDAIVADQQAIAGALAARLRGIPWATSSPSALLHTNLIETYPQVRQWIVSEMAALQQEAGLEPVEWPDRSPHLVLLYTTPSMIDEDARPPAQATFVGPCFQGRVEDVQSFPWHELRDLPRVLVSLGTVNPYLGRRFYGLVLEALRDEAVQVILNAPPAMVSGPLPDGCIVQQWLPQVALLPHVQAVVSHAGSTVNEALAFGVPIVAIPVAYDNFIFADQVVRRGVGLRLRFNRLKSSELRQAVLSVLDEAGYRQAAAEVQREFAAAGGAPAAADAVEALLAGAVTRE